MKPDLNVAVRLVVRSASDDPPTGGLRPAESEATPPSFADPVDSGAPYFAKKVDSGVPFYADQVDSGAPYFADKVDSGVPYFADQIDSGAPYFAKKVTSGVPYFADKVASGVPYYADQVDGSVPYFADQVDGSVPYFADPVDSGEAGATTTAVPAEVPAAGEVPSGLPAAARSIDYRVPPIDSAWIASLLFVFFFVFLLFIFHLFFFSQQFSLYQCALVEERFLLYLRSIMLSNYFE